MNIQWWDNQTRQKGNSTSVVSMCVFARLVSVFFLMKNYVAFYASASLLEYQWKSFE